MIKELNSLKVCTERLTIRVVEDADLKAIYDIHRDHQVNQYLPYDTWLNWHDAKYWYAKVIQRRLEGDAEQFVIIRSIDQQLIGTCIAFDYKAEDQSCEFGYVLNKQFWRQGYMLEAITVFRDSLMARPELSSIRAVVNCENQASLALLDKLGFEIKATLDADNQRSHYLRYEL